MALKADGYLQAYALVMWPLIIAALSRWRYDDEYLVMLYYFVIYFPLLSLLAFCRYGLEFLINFKLRYFCLAMVTCLFSGLASCNYIPL